MTCVSVISLFGHLEKFYTVQDCYVLLIFVVYIEFTVGF